MASTSLRISITLQCSSSNIEPLLVGNSRSNLTNNFLPCYPSSRFDGLCFSSRRRDISPLSVTSKKTNKEKSPRKKVGEDIDIDEDAFEALFHQLEEDLKNDELNSHDDDISEEELAKLEQELSEALGDDELLGALASPSHEEIQNENEDDDDDEEMPIKLKNWQLRRLAYALKNGRRKTSIKNLAADLCLDRAVVLKLLRDPPPELVILSATLPDKPACTIVHPPSETVPLDTITHTEKVEEKVPVHVMQSNWSARKRLKKVQVETLEQVYKRTKRPTNTMVSSIVLVTNLPRKKVVKWFEDKRAEEGVPEHRLPYERSSAQSVFTS